MKKVLGVFFLLNAVLCFIGVASGNVDFGGLGVFFMVVIGLLVLAGAGVFFFVMDRSDRVDFAKGYRMRRKLSIWCCAFLGYFALILVLTCVVYLNVIIFLDFPDKKVEGIVENMFLGVPFIWFMIFACIFSGYFGPFFATKLALKRTDIASYLETGNFNPIAPKSKILVSDKAILFKVPFAVIPIADIAELKGKKSLGIEPYIEIKLRNGKKINITSKEFEALNAHINK